ncbi:MAG TPA: NAD(P)-dependent oxidoreductase, partial [Thermomicrobiales bacterium]|nr:NAD(P)-dependent oxidoreductase [Thermomicrobiales bacterium]
MSAPERPRVGFAGLGRMGHAMAANLLAAGFPLAVWNRTPARAADLAANGVRIAATPRDLAAAADIVLTSLADPAAVEAVYLGPDGLFAGEIAGKTFADLSTVAPALSRRLAAAAAEWGAAFLDAPVAGSIKAAADGTLAVMAGGDRAAFERCAPLFDAIGRVTFYLGGSGAGATM